MSKQDDDQHRLSITSADIKVRFGLRVMVAVKCKFCERVHCEAQYGCRLRFRCRKCKRMQVVTAGERD